MPLVFGASPGQGCTIGLQNQKIVGLSPAEILAVRKASASDPTLVPLIARIDATRQGPIGVYQHRDGRQPRIGVDVPAALTINRVPYLVSIHSEAKQWRTSKSATTTSISASSGSATNFTPNCVTPA